MTRRQRDSFNEINITPLTDIFLVLLIIMMVVAPMLDQQGLNLAVPSNQEEANKIDKEPKIITITVNDNGTYDYDGNVLSSENLISTLKEESKTKTDGLLIQATENSTHGSVVKLMDAARTAGILSISMIGQ